MIQAIAWPAAVLVFSLIFVYGFRAKIGELLGRVKKAGPLELASAPGSHEPLNLKGPTATPKLLHPLENAVMRELEGATRSDPRPSNPTERIDALTTHLAATQLALSLQFIANTIWGTQIDLPLHVNSLPAGVLVNELKVFYDTAAAAHPAGLKEYPYRSYLGFFLNSWFVVESNDRLCTTPFGKEFLAYLARTGETYRRPLRACCRL